jgi:ribonuclease H / adenosylcobalamin/alpha-ribazole phosphatase
VARRLKVVVEADGGARGNPGPAGYGAVVREANTGEVLAERSGAIGIATNNVAEYEGLIAGLQAAADLGAVEVDVRMDSKLVVEQMSGRWRINHPGLRPLAAKAAGLVRAFDTVSYTWVPRERNTQADALANVAMDAAVTAGGTPIEPARVAAAERPAGTRTWEPPSSATATRLVLLRHGATELTAQRRYSGRGDVPLAAEGMAQAEATAARIAALVPAVASVVTSPLRRCTATAEVIAAECGRPPVVVEEDLVECDFGAWEGHTFAEVRARWPRELAAWLGSTTVAPPDGESFAEVAARVARVRSNLLAEYPEKSVIVVSHVSPLKILLRDALAADDAMLYRLYLDPGGLSIVDLWPDGGVAVRSVNDTAHLPAA